MPGWLMRWTRAGSAPVREGQGRSVACSSTAAEPYSRFGYPVYRRALSLLREPQEALDVTQEVFLELVKTPALLEREAGVLPLLYQMVTHRALDRLRHRARWCGVLSLEGPPAEPCSEEDARADGFSPTGSGGLGRVEAAQDLALLTRGESSQTLTIAALYHVEGYTAREIALTLDVSTKTVSRALERFSVRARKRAARLGEEPAR